MAVPKRKRSRARRDTRHANKGIQPQALGSCSHWQFVLASHQVCSQCGYYKGKKVVSTKLDRSIKRAQARQARAAKAPSTGEGSDQRTENAVQ